MLRLANVTGADFSGSSILNASFGGSSDQLRSTASFQSRDLRGTFLTDLELRNADLSYFDLRGTTFNVDVTGADFTGAIVNGAEFHGPTWFGLPGITESQLRSTSSYQRQNLRGLAIPGVNANGWDLSQLNIQNVDMEFTAVDGLNVRLADLRGANISYQHTVTRDNTIWFQGQVNGLELNDGEFLRIENHVARKLFDPIPPFGPFPVIVYDRMTISPAAGLDIVLEEGTWYSTIQFDPDIDVQLDGTLKLRFVEGVDLNSQLGRTFPIFDWTGVTPDGIFTIDSPYVWDTSRVYLDGSATLVALPEPTSGLAWLLGWSLFVRTFAGASARRVKVKKGSKTVTSAHINAV